MKFPRMPRLRRPDQRVVSDVVEAAGLACVDGAVWWWQPIVGLLVLGVMLVFVGWVIGGEPAPQSD